LVPAVARVSCGNVLVGHSALTGESTPADAEPGKTVFTGGLIKRGETVPTVTVTSVGVCEHS